MIDSWVVDWALEEILPCDRECAVRSENECSSIAVSHLPSQEVLAVCRAQTRGWQCVRVNAADLDLPSLEDAMFRSADQGAMLQIASPGMLGVHFAITADQERLLFSADDRGEAEVGEILEDIEETWSDDGLSVSSDKAWDAVHRCLGDGSLDPDGGEYPLSHAVLGGRHLHDEYYVVHVTAAEARDVAEALYRVDETWLRQRFDAIDDTDYGGPHDDEDFGYTWENFMDIRTFYERAAKAGRAVIFTAT